MLSYYKTIDGHITQLEACEPGCWINCIAPTDAEISGLIEDFQIEPDFFRAAMDEEESSHIDTEDYSTLVIIDMPVAETSGDNVTYSTTPQYLKQIDKLSSHVERELRKSMKNSELIQLLDIEKSLVYFSSSLKGSEITIEKISRGRVVKLYEEDQDLLEDVLIEVRQAIEMSSIYLNILSGTMDAFASVISNNLNIVMKVLASITLIISIPTVISSFYGMNVEGLPLPFFWFPLLLAIVSMGIAYLILRKKDMF